MCVGWYSYSSSNREGKLITLRSTYTTPSPRGSQFLLSQEQIVDCFENKQKYQIFRFFSVLAYQGMPNRDSKKAKCWLFLSTISFAFKSTSWVLTSSYQLHFDFSISCISFCISCIFPFVFPCFFLVLPVVSCRAHVFPGWKLHFPFPPHVVAASCLPLLLNNPTVNSQTVQFWQ